MSGCTGPGATHWLACPHREAEWAEVGRENRELREALDAERAARETWEKQAVRLGAELVAAESALASERAAHAETRGAMAADDARLRDAAIRIWGEHIRGCDTPDEMADLIVHLRERLAAAEDCLREIAKEDCTWYPAYKDHPADEPPCPSEIARAFLAGGKP